MHTECINLLTYSSYQVMSQKKCVLNRKKKMLITETYSDARSGYNEITHRLASNSYSSYDLLLKKKYIYILLVVPCFIISSTRKSRYYIDIFNFFQISLYELTDSILWPGFGELLEIESPQFLLF